MAKPFRKLISYFLLLISSFNVASSEVGFPIYYNHSCTGNNNFTSDSPYEFNLYTLLFSLYSNATAAGTDHKIPEFFNTTAGIDADAIYGEYMCRGDVPDELCQSCVQDATNRIASECLYSKEAIIWYDDCFLHYSHRSFFSALHTQPTVTSELGVAPFDIRCTLNASTPCGIPSYLGSKNQTDMGYTRINRSSADPSVYIELNKTLNDAVAEAAIAGTKKFATKEANFSWGSLYTLVECTPDLSPQFCSKCLYGMMQLIPTDRIARSGRILNPSCNLRFGDERFYFEGNLPPSSTQEFGRPRLTSWSCSNSERFSANDPYLNNLGSLIQNLSMSSNVTGNNGFYSTFVGNKPDDTVYGLFMCRGDVHLALCYECVNEGIKELSSSCDSSKEAIIWYDMCMLRYSNRSFFSTVDTKPIYTRPGADMLVTQKRGFNLLLTSTLNGLVAATPKSAGAKNFETKTEFSPSELTTLYTLAQCTPNLSSQDCDKCLRDARSNITSCCLGKKGGQVMNPSCNLRFETYRFYIDSVSTPPTYPPNGGLGPPAYGISPNYQSSSNYRKS